MRSFKTAKTQIRRTPYQALAAILVLTVTFLIGNIFFLIALGSQVILQHFETRPQIIAYIKEGTPPDQLAPLQDTLRNSSQVETVRYVSKEEALSIYKESVDSDPLLLGSLTDLSTITADILPASLEISVNNPDDFPTVIDILKQSDVIDTNARGEKDIDFPQDVVSELNAWTKVLRTHGLILLLALAFSSILTTTIIISMKIRSRRTEIQTMKLLGANSSFISAPYLFESVAYSLAGAFFGWLLTYTLLLYDTPFLAPRLSGIIDFPLSLFLMFSILAGSLFVAIILGTISGLLAVGRFLKTR